MINTNAAAMIYYLHAYWESKESQTQNKKTQAITTY